MRKHKNTKRKSRKVRIKSRRITPTPPLPQKPVGVVGSRGLVTKPPVSQKPNITPSFPALIVSPGDIVGAGTIIALVMAAFSIGWWRAEHRASTVSENSTTPAAHCIYATTFDRQKNILSTADAMWKIEPDARMSVSSISPQPTMSDQPGIVVVEACNER